MAFDRIVVRRLLVEGGDEERIIPYLIEANGVPWGNTKKDRIVEISPYNGISELLRPGVIEAESKVAGLQAIGLVADANGDPHGRWQQIRTRCESYFPSLPEILPRDGFIRETAKPRFGVWMMPDNGSRGMMETFLLCLVPDASGSMYAHAERSRDEAKRLGAPFLEVHGDKALIHTWLAWQDPPGQQLHGAIMKRMLDPTSDCARPFVSWFRELFQV